MTVLTCVPSYATYPTPVLFVLIHLFCLAQSLLYWGTILFRCAAATCAMLAWTFCCAGLSLIPRFSRTSTFLIGTVALTPTVITCTVGSTFQPSLNSSSMEHSHRTRLTHFWLGTTLLLFFEQEKRGITSDYVDPLFLGFLGKSPVARVGIEPHDG